jgi:hypothetical protein
MKYQILEAFNTRSLSSQVNEAIQDGWRLQGGVSYVEYGGCNGYLQAMVKEAQ